MKKVLLVVLVLLVIMLATFMPVLSAEAVDPSTTASLQDQLKTIMGSFLVSVGGAGGVGGIIALALSKSRKRVDSGLLEIQTIQKKITEKTDEYIKLVEAKVTAGQASIEDKMVQGQAVVEQKLALAQEIADNKLDTIMAGVDKALAMSKETTDKALALALSYQERDMQIAKLLEEEVADIEAESPLSGE